MENTKQKFPSRDAKTAQLARIESNRFFDCFYEHCDYMGQTMTNEIDDKGKEYFGLTIICRIHLIPIVVLYFNLQGRRTIE